MAEIIVTKKSVSKPRNGMFSITLNLKVTEDTTTLIDKDFTEIHKIEQTIVNTLNKFKTKMQEAIDFYKAEQVIFTSTQLNSAITVLEGGLKWL